MSVKNARPLNKSTDNLAVWKMSAKNARPEEGMNRLLQYVSHLMPRTILRRCERLLIKRGQTRQSLLRALSNLVADSGSRRN